MLYLTLLISHSRQEKKWTLIAHPYFTPVMWSTHACLWKKKKKKKRKCDQLYSAPDSTVQIIWQGDKRKCRALMNVFPHWMLWKTAFANWPSIPLSVKMAHQMACWAQREEGLSISVKQLRVRQPQQKALTGNGGVDIGWRIMRPYLHRRMK